MKKLGIIALIIATFFVFSSVTNAKTVISYSDGVKCDVKDDYEICTFSFTVNGDEAQKNKVVVDLTLTNVTMSELKGLNGFTIKNITNTSFVVESDANSFKAGTHTFASAKFTKVEKAKECKVEYTYNFSKVDRQCSAENNKYYCLNGEACSLEEYNKQCKKEEPKSCVIRDSKYYDKNGNEVSKDAYDVSCNIVNPETGVSGVSFVVLGLVAIASVSLYLITKKNSKFINL